MRVEMKYNIRWENKYSGEKGYIARVMYRAGHFVNTFEKTKAKKYASVNAARADIARLEKMGECIDNFMDIEEIAAD